MNRFIINFTLLVLSSFAFSEQTELPKEMIDPHWIHEIVEKDPLYWRDFYTFEDGIIWSISCGKNWNRGDQILITYDPEGGSNQWDGDFKMYLRRWVWKFFNITQNQTARGELWKIDNKYTENIARVSGFAGYYNTVILSNGLILYSDQDESQLPIFRNWREGDIVTKVSKEGVSNPHCLWRLAPGDIVCDLQIQ